MFGVRGVEQLSDAEAQARTGPRVEYRATLPAGPRMATEEIMGEISRVAQAGQAALLTAVERCVYALR